MGVDRVVDGGQGRHGDAADGRRTRLLRLPGAAPDPPAAISVCAWRDERTAAMDQAVLYPASFMALGMSGGWVVCVCVTVCDCV